MQYFAGNSFVMNILQTHPIRKPMKIGHLRPKYPPGGEGGTQPAEDRTHPGNLMKKLILLRL
jgi:hypothetical protein